MATKTAVRKAGATAKRDLNAALNLMTRGDYMMAIERLKLVEAAAADMRRDLYEIRQAEYERRVGI